MPEGPPFVPSPGAEVNKSFQFALEVLRRRKWVIAAIFSAVMMGMTAYTTLRLPEYVAYSLLLVNPPRSGGDAETLNFGTLGGTALDIRSQILLLQESLYISERTAERLIQEWSKTKGQDDLHYILDREGPTLSASELAVRLQKKYIHIRPEGDWTSGAIRVTASSAIADEAAFLANTFTEEYVRLAQETSRGRITASRRFLEAQIAKRKEELGEIEQQIMEQLSNKGDVDIDREAQVAIAQIAQLESTLDAVRVEKRGHESVLGALEAELERLRPGIVDAMVSTTKTDVQEKQLRVVELERLVEQIYLRTPELREDPSRNAELMGLLDQITLLKDQIGNLSIQYADELMRGGGVGSASDEGTVARVAQLNLRISEARVAISGATARMAVLEQQLAGYKRELRSIPAQSIEHVQLERARQSVEQLYLSLVGKLQEVRITEESEIGFVRVIRPALVPDAPTRSGGKKMLVFGALLGLMLGVLSAVVLHWMDARIHTPDDLSERGIRMIGAIPEIRGFMKSPGRKKSLISLRNRKENNALVLGPRSPVHEGYQQLYVTLQFQTLQHPVQTLLVTSAEAQVGKSTTAINLAITMAQANRRTLIIDADLHRPSLHRLLGIKPDIGLEALLSEHKVPLDMEYFASDIENLYVITTHVSDTHAARLLGSERMRDLLEELKQSFDIIILDSPPTLVVADSVLLASLCDATLLVAAAGRTHTSALEQAVKDLHNAGAKVIGVVLNRFAAPPMYRHTYGYRDKNYYQYTQPSA